jgi:prephenate dehydrogenase
MKLGSIGIIGYGAFGAFLAVLIKRFAPEVRILVHSSRQAPAGELFHSFEDVCKADAVILAVPIHAFGDTLRKAAPLLGADTIVVDVSTVKSYTAGLLKEILGARRYIATHPMFGPESYAKRKENVAGMRIVVTEHTLTQDEVDAFLDRLRGIGFDVVTMSSDQHDKHLADTLFLTHYIGQIVHASGFERTEIDTVSFGFLMDAVDSVKHDRALFEDVYRFNPYCAETIERFETSERHVRNVLKEATE